jgi:hypothetical protein
MEAMREIERNEAVGVKVVAWRVIFCLCSVETAMTSISCCSAIGELKESWLGEAGRESEHLG